jgi:hypothetical protein
VSKVGGQLGAGFESWYDHKGARPREYSFEELLLVLMMMLIVAIDEERRRLDEPRFLSLIAARDQTAIF